MTSNIQISGKAANGIIFVVGGDNYDDFFVNLTSVFGGDYQTAQAVVNEAATLITPPSVGAAPAQQPPQQQPPQQHYQNQYQQQPQDQFQQAAQVIQGNFPQAQQVPDSRQQPAGPPPGMNAPICPGHNQPAKWVGPGVSKGTGKSYSGFWACAVSQQGDRSCRIAR